MGVVKELLETGQKQKVLEGNIEKNEVHAPESPQTTEFMT